MDSNIPCCAHPVPDQHEFAVEILQTGWQGVPQRHLDLLLDERGLVHGIMIGMPEHKLECVDFDMNIMGLEYRSWVMACSGEFDHCLSSSQRSIVNHQLSEECLR